MPANLEYSAVATGLERVSFHSNPKECSNYHTTALISHTSKVMLKIVNCELPDAQAGGCDPACLLQHGKTRDLFKKITDTKGTFHAKMGSIKDRNGINLTEADLMKRWQEYTEELYKKIIMTQIIT